MVRVHEVRGHDTVSWIPQKYWNKLHIIPDDADQLAFDRDINKPLVVIEHGIMDITMKCKYPEERDCYSLLYADYYLCSTKESYDGLIAKGKKAFYTGMAFADIVKPVVYEPSMLVYMPDHGIMDPVTGEWIHMDATLSKSALEGLVEEHDCDNFITSALSEDPRYLDYHRIVMSNRNNVQEHLDKCKSLMSIAKVVVSPVGITFAVVAKALGIKVVADKELLTTLADGKCKERILDTLDAIISRRV